MRKHTPRTLQAPHVVVQHTYSPSLQERQVGYGEIRQAIYEQYYRGSSERVIYFTHNGRQGKCVVRVTADPAQCSNGLPLRNQQPMFDLVAPDSNLLSLALACRQIYAECMPILYSEASLRFLSADALLAFAGKTPAQYLAHVDTLTLEAPGYSLLDDYFDTLQWRRAWQYISRLQRLRCLTVKLLDSERSISRRNWDQVLEPMIAAVIPADFHVMLHCEPDVLPRINATAPFRISWQDADGDWHRIDCEHSSV